MENNLKTGQETNNYKSEMDISIDVLEKAITNNLPKFA